MKNSYLSLICLILAACSNQEVSQLNPPVADSIMIEVLIELHLAEASVELFHQDQVAFKDSILARYALSREMYEANMAFYRAHPEAYHQLYSEALDKLSDERYLPDED